MLADEGVGAGPQGPQVERLGHVPGRGGQERVGHGPVEDRVAVGPGRGREAGVEVVVDPCSVAHDDLRAAASR